MARDMINWRSVNEIKSFDSIKDCKSVYDGFIIFLKLVFSDNLKTV